MERKVSIFYEDNAKAGGYLWRAEVVIRTRTNDLDEVQGFGMTALAALDDLCGRLSEE